LTFSRSASVKDKPLKRGAGCYASIWGAPDPEEKGRKEKGVTGWFFSIDEMVGKKHK